MKTILITGGAGYIGSHTVRELIQNGYEVVVFDSLENGHRKAIDPKAKLEVANLHDIESIRNVFGKYQIDAVIDFAAYLAVGESMLEPEKYLQNNVFNFINLLDIMNEFNCKYIIKSSTAAVYGNPIQDSDIPWKETFTENYTPHSSALLEGKWGSKTVLGESFFQEFFSAYTKYVSNRNKHLLLNNEEISKLRIPMSIYGLSKLLDEVIMNKYDDICSIKSIALRYFNVCGAHPNGDLGDDKPNPSNLMTLVMLQAIGKIPEVKIFGRDYNTPDGTGVRDYIHPCDLASGHVKALQYLIKSNLSDIINLGTGQDVSVLDLIKAVENACKKKIITVDMPRRSGDPSISIADAGKSNTLLGWQAKNDINDMARTAWKWHSTHPEGFDENDI